MIVVRHLACGGVAFHLTRPMRIGDPLYQTDVQYPDGLRGGRYLECDHCGATPLFIHTHVSIERPATHAVAPRSQASPHW